MFCAIPNGKIPENINVRQLYAKVVEKYMNSHFMILDGISLSVMNRINPKQANVINMIIL